MNLIKYQNETSKVKKLLLSQSDCSSIDGSVNLSIPESANYDKLLRPEKSYHNASMPCVELNRLEDIDFLEEENNFESLNRSLQNEIEENQSNKASVEEMDELAESLIYPH